MTAVTSRISRPNSFPATNKNDSLHLWSTTMTNVIDAKVNESIRSFYKINSTSQILWLMLQNGIYQLTRIFVARFCFFKYAIKCFLNSAKLKSHNHSHYGKSSCSTNLSQFTKYVTHLICCEIHFNTQSFTTPSNHQFLFFRLICSQKTQTTAITGYRYSSI